MIVTNVYPSMVDTLVIPFNPGAHVEHLLPYSRPRGGLTEPTCAAIE